MGMEGTADIFTDKFGLMVNEPNVMREELAKIQVKTLVIAGTNDIS